MRGRRTSILGLSAGLDFETQIFVKEDAPELLRAELALDGVGAEGDRA